VVLFVPCAHCAVVAKLDRARARADRLAALLERIQNDPYFKEYNINFH